MYLFRFFRVVQPIFFLWGVGVSTAAADTGWEKHVVFEGEASLTAVAADFTGDGITDIIANTGEGVTRLFIGPSWKHILLDDTPCPKLARKEVLEVEISLAMHSQAFDVDEDGDTDYISACYNPGLITWYEQPNDPLRQKWVRRLIDNRLHGVHGLVVGDVDQDGKPDLLATSARPKPPFPNSLAWLTAPADPRFTELWALHIFADQDAPGLAHYLGVGDINGDGRVDAATGAKGGKRDSTGKGGWFAWWEAPVNPALPWRKHNMPGYYAGATNIHPADINGDGRPDLIASRGHDQGVLWFEAPAWTPHIIDKKIHNPHSLVVADMNSDGAADAATCGYGDELCVWYENDGNGQFTRHLLGAGQQAYDMRAVDLDGDRDLDLLVAGRGSNNVVWYQNPYQMRGS